MAKDNNNIGIIFDLDGTLLDTEPLSTQAINTVLHGVGAPSLPWELKKQICGLPASKWTRILIQKMNINNKLLTPIDFQLQWEENLEKLYASAQMLDGVEKFTSHLFSCGIPMAIATSSSSNQVIHKRIYHEKLFSRFQTIISCDHPAVRNGKPAPDIFLVAAESIGIEPSYCIVFEDALSGVNAGIAANMKVIAIPTQGIETEQFVQQATSVLSSMSDFVPEMFGLPPYQSDSTE